MAISWPSSWRTASSSSIPGRPCSLRSLFYYSDEEQFGTGRAEYDELAECVSLLLKLQADHETQRQGVQTGMTGGQIN